MFRECSMPNAQCRMGAGVARTPRQVYLGHSALGIDKSFYGNLSSPSLSSIDVPQGSVMKAIHISDLGT
jgi:hypothetical protein